MASPDRGEATDQPGNTSGIKAVSGILETAAGQSSWDRRSELVIRHGNAPCKQCPVNHPAIMYTLWFHQKQECDESWSNNLLEIHTGTAEDILEELNEFGLPSAPGRSKCDLCIFRSHIVPMWEDPLQERGGRWVVEVKGGKIDLAWYRTIMEWFRTEASPWSSVTGVYLMVRSNIKIAMWFADSTNAAEVDEIRAHWGSVIGPELIKHAVCQTYHQK